MTYYAEALQSDVSDIQGGTTAEGVHLGAMAGTVDLIQRVSTGIEVTGDVLRLNPQPPPELKRLDLQILPGPRAGVVASMNSCHEEDGHYRYLMKEMRKLAAGHRFNVDEDLARFLSSLKADEMQGLADYLSRMQGPIRDRTPEE